MRKLFAVLFIISLLSSCGYSDGSQGVIVNPNITPEIGSKNFLSTVSISGNVIKAEQRFLSYAKNVNRISIIDPKFAIETWKLTVTNFDFAVALPDYRGVTLLAGDKVEVKSGNDSKTFQLQSDYSHASTAENTAAYSLSSTDGNTFEIVRSLTKGQWQHQTFTVPWPAIDLGNPNTTATQSVLLLTQFNADGTQLYVFSPMDGRYTVFTAPSISEPILSNAAWCVGDGIGTPQNISYSSLTWNENQQMFFAGDVSGNIYALDPNGNCKTPATVDSFLMKVPNQVVQIAVYDNNVLGVMQDVPGTRSQISLIAYNNTTGVFTDTGQTIGLSCERPIRSISTLNANTRRIIVMCRQPNHPESESADASGQLLAQSNPYQYLVIDYDSGLEINSITLDRNKTSGVAISRSTNTLYRMDQGAFGILETINLLNGESTNTVGLFISEYLD